MVGERESSFGTQSAWMVGLRQPAWEILWGLFGACMFVSVSVVLLHLVQDVEFCGGVCGSACLNECNTAACTESIGVEFCGGVCGSVCWTVDSTGAQSQLRNLDLDVHYN